MYRGFTRALSCVRTRRAPEGTRASDPLPERRSLPYAPPPAAPRVRTRERPPGARGQGRGRASLRAGVWEVPLAQRSEAPEEGVCSRGSRDAVHSGDTTNEIGFILAAIPRLGSRRPASAWGAPSPRGRVVFCLHSGPHFEHLRSLFP